MVLNITVLLCAKNLYIPLIQVKTLLDTVANLINIEINENKMHIDQNGKKKGGGENTPTHLLEL